MDACRRGPHGVAAAPRTWKNTNEPSRRALRPGVRDERA